MAFPIKPSDIKALLPTVSGNFCSRWKKLISFPTALNSIVEYLAKEDGTPTDQFQADLCALSCIGSATPGGGTTPPPNPEMPAPILQAASDGSLPTSVDVSWEAVTPPGGTTGLKYRVYRSLCSNTNPNNATLIATVDAPTVTYNDASVVVGVFYRYWIVAFNAVPMTSTFSNSDCGNAAAPLVTLDAISDLSASRGFALSDASAISLVFTPPDGAQRYDVWRNTVNTFGTATKIISAIEPDDATSELSSDNTPDQCWDNQGEILIMHFPPSATVKYFFWIVARGDSPPSISPESNSAQGWLRTFDATFDVPDRFILQADETLTEGVDFDATTAYIVLFSGGGGGAGGGDVYGGGGGGGGGIVVETFAIPSGAVLSLEAVDNVANTGNAAMLTDGLDGPTMTFKINGVAKMVADGGGGGIYEIAGGGAGGIWNSGSGTTSPTVYPGRPGLPSVGAAGGASGYVFGARRFPAAHFDGIGIGSWPGDAPAQGGPGGGSHAAPGTPSLAVGGYGQVGYAIIAFGT